MRPSNKSRNRNKNNNRRGSAGNNINRVFESAGPEGRVRGTPQQIIDKYLSLTYDAQLSGDRVAAENFQQHAEHYARLLIEAQKEIAEKQSEQNSTSTISKPESKLSEDISVASSNQVEQIDKQEEKIVKFGNSLEKQGNKSQSETDKEKTGSPGSSRKISRKSSTVDSESLEI